MQGWLLFSKDLTILTQELKQKLGVRTIAVFCALQEIRKPAEGCSYRVEGTLHNKPEVKANNDFLHFHSFRNSETLEKNHRKAKRTGTVWQWRACPPCTMVQSLVEEIKQTKQANSEPNKCCPFPKKVLSSLPFSSITWQTAGFASRGQYDDLSSICFL